MPRNTEKERRSVENLAKFIKGGYAERGREMTGEQARERAVRIAERSDAERREGKRR